MKLRLLEPFRALPIKATLGLVLGMTFLNFSINTIDREYKSEHQTSSQTEIETFTELILDDFFKLNLIADSEEQESEHSTSSIFGFCLTMPVDFLLAYPKAATLLPLISHHNIFVSRSTPPQSPPPKIV
jgi:hypothetical protein